MRGRQSLGACSAPPWACHPPAHLRTWQDLAPEYGPLHALLTSDGKMRGFGYFSRVWPPSKDRTPATAKPNEKCTQLHALARLCQRGENGGQTLSRSDRVGAVTGHSMPIAGSSQRIPNS